MPCARTAMARARQGFGGRSCVRWRAAREAGAGAGTPTPTPASMMPMSGRHGLHGSPRACRGKSADGLPRSGNRISVSVDSIRSSHEAGSLWRDRGESRRSGGVCRAHSRSTPSRRRCVQCTLPQGRIELALLTRGPRAGHPPDSRSKPSAPAGQAPIIHICERAPGPPGGPGLSPWPSHSPKPDRNWSTSGHSPSARSVRP